MDLKVAAGDAGDSIVFEPLKLVDLEVCVPCEICNGTGRKTEKTCFGCDGRGFLVETIRVLVAEEE